MKEIKLTDLLEAGCHFGHQTTRWNPKMKPYIYSARDRIHIFDLVKTKDRLEKAGRVLAEITSQGGQVVFVATKRQSQDLVKETAIRLGMPYVTERWIGGLITNWPEVSRRIKKLNDWIKLRESGGFQDRTKREVVLIDREIAKLKRRFGGVSELAGVPAAIVVTDAHKNISALLEAKRGGVTVVAIADTNANPDIIDYPIPANDDAVKSVELIVDYLAEAIEEGRNQKAQKRKMESAEKQADKAEEVEDNKVGRQKLPKTGENKQNKVVNKSVVDSGKKTGSQTTLKPKMKTQNKVTKKEAK